MNLLDKLDLLMESAGLNKKQLAERSDVPYTTIVSFYTKGYDKMKLSTLKSLANFFNVSIDYLGCDEITDPHFGISKPTIILTQDEHKLIELYRTLNDQGKEHILTCVATAQALFKEESSDISVMEGNA